MNIIRYCMIVTAEDERYGTEGYPDTGYWADNPWDGDLQDIVFGQDIKTLWKPENEGLFYQLYDLQTGKRIGYGTVFYDSIQEEIEMNERESK